MPIRTFQVTAPAGWASYLINDDASGLSDEEKGQADAMLQDIMAETGKAWCVDCDGSVFRWNPDYGMAGDCCTFTFHV